MNQEFFCRLFVSVGGTCRRGLYHGGRGVGPGACDRGFSCLSPSSDASEIHSDELLEPLSN